MPTAPGERLVEIFERVCEHHLIQPTIIYDYPVEIRRCRRTSRDEPAFVERFEIYAAGMEIGNAYTELNDPQEQRRRFEMQLGMAAARRRRSAPDGRGLSAGARYGMPPTGGEGIGIDRLTMILTDSRSIRDVILFPLLRPEGRHRHRRRSSCGRLMMREFELFVALRYLRAKRKQAVISVITVISVLGVAAGVMALVIALAINNGFRGTLQRNLLGATAHVSILEKEPGYGIENWRDLAAQVCAKLPHVTAAAPSLYGPVMIAGPVQATGAILKGIESAKDQAEMLTKLKQGSFERLSDKSALPGIILGARLAQNTGMMLNSIVRIISPQGELTPFGRRITEYQFRVVGIFESGFYDWMRPGHTRRSPTLRWSCPCRTW